MKIKLTCKCCEREFEVQYKFRDKKFCSRNCYFNAARQGKTKMGKSKDPNVREIRNCKVCNTEFEVRKKDPKTMCSDKCRVEWGGKEEIKQKRLESLKNSTQEKYGVDHVWKVKEIHQKTIDNRNDVLMGLKVSEKLKSKSKEEWLEINQKKESTKEKIYGDKFYNNSEQISKSLLNKYEKDGESIIKKREYTMLSKYNVRSALQLDECRSKLVEIKDEVGEKISKTLRKNQLERVIKKLSSHNLELVGEYVGGEQNTFKCCECGHTFTSTVIKSGLIPICRRCNPIESETKISKKIRDILEDNKINFIPNDRKLIYPYEVDFYIPEYNLAIEVNGNYFHSELMGQKNKNYHLVKTKLCNDKKIKLIHIYEDEINNSYDIVKSRIHHLINKQDKKIYARKCIIKEITSKVKKEFLTQNHLQGDCKDTIRYGLFYGEELVSVITFGKRKITKSNKEPNWELIRFCNKNYYSIVGGFSKLLSHVLKNHNIKNFITYTDIRWSGYDKKETVYSKNNMAFVGYTPPSYWYMDKKNYNYRINRFTFRKDLLVKEGFDPNKTEWEIMQERGFDRIWDCGNIKFVYEN